MNIALWVVQGVLAAAFLMAGGMKLAKPHGELAEQMDWVEDFSPQAVKLIGVVELFGAIGLVLPGVTGIAPVLVPLAAVGLGIDMVGAAVLHARRSETQMMVSNAVLFVLAAFIAWGRFGDYPL